MNEIIRKWIERLRSGLDEQHIGGWGYPDKGRVCAAGVLKYKMGLSPRDYMTVAYSYYDKSGLTLQGKVVQWNDDEKLTFPQIAYRLEEFLNGRENAG